MGRRPGIQATPCPRWLSGPTPDRPPRIARGHRTSSTYARRSESRSRFGLPSADRAGAAPLSRRRARWVLTTSGGLVGPSADCHRLASFASEGPFHGESGAVRATLPDDVPPASSSPRRSPSNLMQACRAEGRAGARTRVGACAARVRARVGRACGRVCGRVCGRLCGVGAIGCQPIFATRADACSLVVRC